MSIKTLNICLRKIANMSNVNKLLKNTAIFGISNFASKFLVLLLLPFYTRVLSTSDFGSADLLISVISFIIPILTLCVSEGALRFALGKSTDNKQVFTYGLFVIIIGFIFLVLLYPILIKISVLKNNIIFFYTIFASSALNDYFNKYIRGLNKIKLIGFVGVLSTLVLVLSNILFLVIFELGIEGYLISYFLMNFVSLVILFFAGGLYNRITLTKIAKSSIREMNSFNIPLIPNRVSWILISSFNKYSITFFWGTSLVGIFSAANRIPSLITVIYGIIQQALLLVVIEEYEDKENSEIFTKTYHVLGTVLLLLVIIINVLIKPMASFLFSKNFYDAYKIAPILVLSAYFGALHGNLTTIYSANKKTSVLFHNSFLGMILTMILSIVLVPIYGMYGAVATSLIVYFLMWFRLYRKTKGIVKFEYSIKEDLICYLLVLVHWFILMSFEGVFYYLLSFCIITLVLIIQNKRLRSLVIIMNVKCKEFSTYLKKRRQNI